MYLLLVSGFEQKHSITIRPYTLKSGLCNDNDINLMLCDGVQF